MRIEQLDKPAASMKRSPWLVFAIAVGVVLLGLIIHNARNGAVSPRIRNPNDTGGPHPLSDPLFGYGHWIVTIEIFSYLALVSIIALIAVLWRRYPNHPYLLMTIAVSTLAWLDAPMNWATFAAYNPDLWHWPEDWPIVSLSPTIEPLFIAAIAIFVVPPFFPAIWVLRHLQARRPLDSFVSRHPLISLSDLRFRVRIRLRLRHGRAVRPRRLVHFHPSDPLRIGLRRYPLAISPAVAVLADQHSDDSGRGVDLSRRHRTYCRRAAGAACRAAADPASAWVRSSLMLIGVNLAFMTYGVVYTAVTRWSGAATSIVCPWPWPSAKVYDPQGFYEQSGAPGPFSEGIWSTWESAQPSGRPSEALQLNGGRCAPARIGLSNKQ